jgi:hypothetical protein
MSSGPILSLQKTHPICSRQLRPTFFCNDVSAEAKLRIHSFADKSIAAFEPDWQIAAFIAGLISVGSFIYLGWTSEHINPLISASLS